MVTHNNRLYVSFWQNVVVVTIVVLGLMLQSMMASADANNRKGNPVVTPIQSQYADLAVKHWRWVLGQPIATNATFDTTGELANYGQPIWDNIFFLAGALTLSATPIPGGGSFAVDRTITIPSGKQLFFPILNYFMDNAGDPPASYKLDELRGFVIDSMNSVSAIHASIDGVPVKDLFGHRVELPVFYYTLPCEEENFAQYFGINICGHQPPQPGAVGAGYYLLLNPLSPGEHEIKFGGTSGSESNNSLFVLDVTYHITVQRGPRH